MGAGGDEMCDKDRSMDADGWVETAVPLSLRKHPCGRSSVKLSCAFPPSVSVSLVFRPS